MSIIEGVVQKVSKRGNATNILVNEQWYGCGFNGVPCQEGDQISVPVTQNGRFLNADVKNMQILGRGNTAPQQQQAPRQYADSGKQAYGGGKKASGGGFSRKMDDPVQISIVQQSARNAAIQAVQLAAQLEAVPLPAKKADKFDALLALVDQVTERYFKSTQQVASDGGYVERAEKVSYQKTEQGAPSAEYDDDIPF